MAKFEIAYLKLRKWEGGQVDDPIDPGGRTNAGITQKSWNAWAKENSTVSAKDVFHLTEEEIKAFYLCEYWLPIFGRHIESQPVADFLFSMAVLQGKKAAVRRMQRILGVVADGVMGSKTLAAINAFDSLALVRRYADANREFFASIISRKPSQARFARGWENRIKDLA